MDASGNWTDWNGPWNSGLKLHAAGALYSQAGYRTNMGTAVSYWSSQQRSFVSNGWILCFHNLNSFTGGDAKAAGSMNKDSTLNPCLADRHASHTREGQ